MSRYSGHIYDTVVCFGDSLTQHGWNIERRGWTAQLAHAYIRRFDVINRGFSGFTTRLALRLLPQILPPSPVSSTGSKLRLLTIMFGSNDAALAPSRQHVPIDEFRNNIVSMVKMVTCPESKYFAPDTKILLITPPPLGEQEAPAERTFASVKACADAVRDVAMQLSIPCVDFWSAMVSKVSEDGQGGYERFLWDGLHLNAAGNDLLFTSLMQAIRQHFPDMGPDTMLYALPDYRVISSDEEEMARQLQL
ncbi:isoamyl acetate-hydrolyzing esterase [Coemansia thaxteri]|uniref:Isoamyl acetate-hydrolyzing esterase n=1 Tax=Coemansia thaxteri TaxID=2663907 RepID=A0A9W8BA72_9FUNG|nr:isoamyl acetate-hydrolyzing esterase [Coemansia thaxteri]